MTSPRKTPAPSRRDKELTKALNAQVASDAKQHRGGTRNAGLTVMDSKTLKHRDGATLNLAINDGWKNMLTGMGMVGDKRMYQKARWDLSLTEEEAEELYAGDPTARRIVDIMPNEATREGIVWNDPEKSTKIDDELKRLGVWPNMREGAIYGRLYGGGGLLMVDNETPIDKLWQPWRPGAEIQSLVPLTRWELWAYATELQRDLTKPDFGKPIRYRLFPRMTFGQTAITVHASRIVRFDGKLLPRLLFIRNNYWHDSILTSLTESLADYKGAFASVASALADFRIMVHKIKGLSDAVNSGHEDKIRTRLAIMNQARSIMGAWAIDAEDDAAFQSGALTGLADSANLLKERLQGETDIPHTVLFNEGPGGALAGGQAGNHEERNWYNAVHAYQVNYIKPRFDQLLGVILAQRGMNSGDVADNLYDFKSLWQEDEGDQATTELAQAQADKIYVDLQVRTPEAVQKERFPEEFDAMPASADFAKPVEPGVGGGADNLDDGSDAKPGGDGGE